MTTRTYVVEGMTCSHCVGSVTEQLNQVPGVTGVEGDLTSGQVTVESDGTVNDSAVAAAVQEAGYEVAA